MANGKWETIPSQEQIRSGMARSCLPSIRETVERLSEMYGNEGRGAIQQYVLLVLRTPPEGLRELNRRVNGMIEQPDGIMFGEEIRQHAALMTEVYLKAQNRCAQAYPYASDFRSGLSEVVRDSMRGIKRQVSIMPKRDAAQQKGMLRINGAHVAAPKDSRAVVKIRPGDRVDDPVYRPWVMVLEPERDAQLAGVK